MPEPFGIFRVPVVDDPTAVRAGLNALLECAPGMRVSHVQTHESADLGGSARLHA